MELNKYGKLTEKHLKANKPEFYDRLVKDNNLDVFLPRNFIYNSTTYSLKYYYSSFLF